MTIETFYMRVHGDYRDTLQRLPMPDLIVRFVKQFPQDPSYGELVAAVEKGDIKASFESSHKMKGLAANLGFTQLYRHLVALNEQLRPQTAPADAKLMGAVMDDYALIMEYIPQID